MDDARLPSSGPKRSSEVARTLSDKRRRAREFLDSQRNAIAATEAQLLEEIGRITEQLSAPPATDQSGDPQLDERAEQLALQAMELAALTEDLARREVEIEAARDAAAEMLQQREQELAAREEQLKSLPIVASDSSDSHEADQQIQAELAALREELSHQREQLDEKRKESKAERTKLKEERRQLAAEQEEARRQREATALLQTELEHRQQDLQEQRERLKQDRESLTAQHSAVEHAREAITASQAELARVQEQLRIERERLASDLAQMDVDRELNEQLADQQKILEFAQVSLEQERRKLLEEREQIAMEHAGAQLEREELAAGEAQCSRLHERLDADRQRLEADLDQLASDQAAARIALERTEIDRQQIARLRERLEEEKKQLEKQREQLAAERTQLKATQDTASAEKSEYARGRNRLDVELKNLAKERDSLAELETKTKQQRREIAREFQVRHAAQLSELERRKAELQAMSAANDVDLREQSTAAQEEGHRIREETAQLRKQLDARSDELSETHNQVAKLEKELDLLRTERDRLTQQLAINDSITEQDDDALERLQVEHAALIERLAEAERKLVEKDTTTHDDSDELSEQYQDLQRRHEMTVEDLRELKQRNAELESKLAKGSTGSQDTSCAGGVAMDWEAQKRRLLASLEPDADMNDDEDDPEREERLSIGETIRITDDIVAEKDRQIAELQQRLEESGEQNAASNTSRSEAEAILDRDELIKQERERLSQLQIEWEQKLRQAEIDLSVERAKLARQQAELNEKHAAYQTKIQQQKATGETKSDSTKSGKPTRERWLSRLGLKDIEPKDS